jgi:hypothetical protein
MDRIEHRRYTYESNRIHEQIISEDYSNIPVSTSPRGNAKTAEILTSNIPDDLPQRNDALPYTHKTIRKEEPEPSMAASERTPTTTIYV